MIQIKNKPNCGCERGYFSCPEAVRLWQKVCDAYCQAQATTFSSDEDWANYIRVREEYNKHFEEAEE